MSGSTRGELPSYDTYVSNRTSAEKHKHVSSAYVAGNGSESSKMKVKNGGRFGQAFRAAKSQDSKEVLCYNCQKKRLVARFCPRSNVARRNSQTDIRSPGNVMRCCHCHSTQHLARFCTKANNSGDRDGPRRRPQSERVLARCVYRPPQVYPAATL